MKKTFFLFAIISILNSSYAQDAYYWYKNTKQYLYANTNKQYITTCSSSDISYLEAAFHEAGIKYDDFQRIPRKISM